MRSMEAAAMPEQAAEPQKQKKQEKEATPLAMKKFREGLGRKFGNIMLILALFSLWEVIKGVKGKVTAPEQKKLILKQLPPDASEEMKKVVKDLSAEDLMLLQDLNPDSTEISDGTQNVYGAINFYYDVTPEEYQKDPDAFNKEVIPGETNELSGEAYFYWAQKDFGKADLKKQEEQMLRQQVEVSLDKAFKEYSNWHIDSNEALDSVLVNGEVSSSPEGFRFPEKNQKLSEKRAEVLNKVIFEILTQKYGVEPDKIEIKVKGIGAQGDVLDFTKELRNLGWKFKKGIGQNKKELKIETEKVIRKMNQGEVSEIVEKLKKLNPSSDINEKKMTQIFVDTIASKRKANFDVLINMKNLSVITKKDQLVPVEPIIEEKHEPIVEEYQVKEYYVPKEPRPRPFPPQPEPQPQPEPEPPQPQPDPKPPRPDKEKEPLGTEEQKRMARVFKNYKMPTRHEFWTKNIPRQPGRGKRANRTLHFKKQLKGGKYVKL